MKARGLLAAAMILTGAASARAQTAPPGRIELGAGVEWIGRATLGASDATETTASGTTSRLFSTSTVLDGVAGVAAHVNVRITRRFEAVFETSRAKPTLATTITSDLESTGTVTATELVTQYAVSAGALWYLPLTRPGARLSPFAIGTVGYLRQLHEAATLAATGRIYEIGAGAKYLLSSNRRSFVKGFGVRGEVRAVARSKGIAFDDGPLYSPSFGASFFARF